MIELASSIVLGNSAEFPESVQEVSSGIIRLLNFPPIGVDKDATQHL